MVPAGEGRAGSPLPAVGLCQRKQYYLTSVRREEDCPPYPLTYYAAATLPDVYLPVLDELADDPVAAELLPWLLCPPPA